MPFSPELGMNVWDPERGVREGQVAGSAFNQSFRSSRELALDDRKLKMVEQEVADKAKATLRRNIGMQQMQEETARLVANGVDPDTARKNAFFKAAPLLLGDSEQGASVLERLMASEEAASVKREAQIQLNRRADEANDLKRELSGERMSSKLQDQQINLLKMQAAQSDKEAQRTLESTRETGRNERARADRMLKATKDAKLQQIDSSIRAAHANLQAKESNPYMHWFTNVEGTKKAISDLEAERSKRLKELGLDETGEESTSPSGTEPAAAKKILKWNDKTNMLEE